MIKNPIFIFEGTASTGLDKVPLNRLIFIEDSDDSGTPLLVMIIDKTNIIDTTTISTFLDLTAQYKKMSADKTTIDALQVDAGTLDTQEGTYYLDWTNTSNKPDPTITLGTDLSGNIEYVNPRFTSTTGYTFE